jgi:hypothetical protein
MSVAISDKAIVLTKYDNLVPLITDILLKNNISSSFPAENFTSLDSFIKKVNQDKNFAFMKKDILSFISEYGYPFIIITDMRINTGLDSDPENIRALKTLLISYIIIMQSNLYSNISCNLLILADKREYKYYNEYIIHPQKFISTLKTNDNRLNTIIQDLAINDVKFNRNFNVLITEAEQDPSLIRSEIVLFLNMIKTKEKLKNKLVQEKAQPAGPKINAVTAADVVLRSGALLFRNGKEPVDSETSDLNEREIYILGNFTSYTRIEVIERLLSLIKKGFGDEFSLKSEDLFVINIPGNTVIDTTLPITIAQLMSRELHDYKNLKIRTTSSNYSIMQQSKGFSMIQKNIILCDK